MSLSFELKLWRLKLKAEYQGWSSRLKSIRSNSSLKFKTQAQSFKNQLQGLNFRLMDKANGKTLAKISRTKLKFQVHGQNSRSSLKHKSEDQGLSSMLKPKIHKKSSSSRLQPKTERLKRSRFKLIVKAQGSSSRLQYKTQADGRASKLKRKAQVQGLCSRLQFKAHTQVWKTSFKLKALAQLSRSTLKLKTHAPGPSSMLDNRSVVQKSKLKSLQNEAESMELCYCPEIDRSTILQKKLKKKLDLKDSAVVEKFWVKLSSEQIFQMAL